MKKRRRRNPLKADLHCPSCGHDVGKPIAPGQVTVCPGCHIRILPTYVIGAEVNIFYYARGPVRR